MHIFSILANFNYLFWFSLHKARNVAITISVERKKSEQTLFFKKIIAP